MAIKMNFKTNGTDKRLKKQFKAEKGMTMSGKGYTTLVAYCQFSRAEGVELSGDKKVKKVKIANSHKRERKMCKR